VVFGVVLNLTSGRVQPTTDYFLRILPPVPQPPFQILPVWRQNEDAYRFRNLPFDFTRSLHIDVQQEVVTSVFRFMQKPPRRAVILAAHFFVSKNLRVLQKLIGCDHGFKFFPGDEKIFLAVLFASPRRARCVRDREVQMTNHLEQFVHQRGFARTRGRGNNVNDAHSRFCTCSRDFSISDFISSPISVIFKASPARPEVFESSVLASRFISCSRKSSFLPTSPPWSSNPRKCFTCAFSRTSSSWMSLRSTSTATSCRIRSLSTCAPSTSSRRACKRSE